MKAAFLGIDLGSTALKVAVSDGISQVMASATVPVAIDRPRSGYAEQSPENWWKALVSACKQLNLKDKNIAGVSFSGQMHGAVLLDRSNHVLRPAILWNDSRAVAEAQHLQLSVPHLAAQAGVTAMASFVAPKLLWVKKHEPAVFSQIDCVMAPKDYLRLRLTGQRASDPVDACGMWLLDAGTRQWSAEIAAACGIGMTQLPDIQEATTQAGSLQNAAARALGLVAGIPVITGTGDAAASALGLGVVNEGQGVISMGTAAQIIVVRTAHIPIPGKAVHAYCFGLPGRWFQMAALLDGASPLAFVTRLLKEEDVAGLLARVERRMARPSTLLALPYLSGIRTPHDDPLMRGAIAGIEPTTDRVDLARAMLEGVALSLADCHEGLTQTGAIPESLLIVGGGARSRLWVRMIASALGRPLRRAQSSDLGAAMGATRLARLGVTREPFERICVPPKQQEMVKPQRMMVDHFARQLPRFRQFYQAIKNI